MLSQSIVNVAGVGATFILYFLILVSIGSVAVIFERYFFFKKVRKDSNMSSSELRALIRKKDYKRALELSSKNSHFESKLTQALLEVDKIAPASIEVRGMEVLLSEKRNWDRNLTVLATIGSNAPFVGLLGTVLGIIRAFKDLSVQVEASASTTITAGLSEALVATALGILVAIPAVVAFNAFQSILKSELTRAEAYLKFLMIELGDSSHK